jgi:hypothetical protein
MNAFYSRLTECGLIQFDACSSNQELAQYGSFEAICITFQICDIIEMRF